MVSIERLYIVILITLLAVLVLFTCKNGDQKNNYLEVNNNQVEDSDNNSNQSKTDYLELKSEDGYGNDISLRYPDNWVRDDKFDPGYLITTTLWAPQKSALIYVGASPHDLPPNYKRGDRSEWENEKGCKVIIEEWLDEDDELALEVATISKGDRFTNFELWIMDNENEDTYKSVLREIIDSVSFI